MEKLSATMTQLYSDAMPEEAIEGMIDFATAVAKVVDNFGLFQGALSSLGVVGGAKIISTIASNWTGLLSAITSPLGIGTIAVGGAVAAISAYQKSVSEMVESAKQAGDEWESGQENLQGQIDKISELRTALDSGTLSEQEAASAKSELLSIQESLSESYGSQVAGIDLVNGSLTEQIALLDKVSAKEAERFQNENEKGIDKATKEIEKERHEYLGQFYDNGTQESEDIKKSIKDLQDKYGDDVFTTELEADGITMDLHFNADASTAREALNDFKTDISDIKKQYGESDVLNLLGDNASAGLSKANKVLDEYGDLYNQAQKAKLVADDDTYKAPSGKEQTAVKWLNDETKAVEAYNDALSEGNSDAIKQASTEFEAVDSAVQSLLKNSGMSEYADQFTEVKDQLNESAISANKFNEALSGNDSSKFGKQVKKSADALKELGLTDTDFKYAFETDGIQEGEDQINSLVDSAIQCGYISDTSSEQVSKLVSVLSSLGVISSTTGEAVGDATEEVASSVDTMSDALDSAKEKQTNLIDALGNSRSATGLTKDDINNVTSAFKDLDNFDPASIFEETATGVHLNTQALKEYNDELEQQTKNNFAEAITNKQQELNDAIAQNKSQDVIDGLQEEVQTLQLLSAQYDGATSSYNKFVTAASSANERDSFEDVAKSYESIGQLIEQGWTTDDSVTNYLDLLLGTDRIQDSQQAYEQLGQTIEGTGHSLKDYMTFDDDGNFTSQGAWSFVDDVANKLGDDFVKVGEDGEYAFDLTGDKINQVADAFNTTTDFVELMGKALADAGANVSFDSSDVKNYNEQMKQLQETANTTQEKLKEVQSATSGESGEGLLSGIDLNYDKASMSIDQLDSKIAELSGKREEISVSADTEEGQQAISALDNEIASLQSQKIMVSIGTQLEGGATVDELLAITDDAELAAKLQIDVSQVAEARQQLQTLKDTGNIEVPVTVKLDEGQFNSLIESLTGEAVEVPAEVETPEIPDISGKTVEYPSKVDTPDVPDVQGKEITYTSTVDTPDLPDIQGGIAYYEPQVEGSADGETAEGTINYDKGTVESADGETSEGIINYDKGDVEKADGTVSTGTINYDLGTVAVPTGMVASGTINYALGTVATPGKAMGTFGQARAYAKGSLTDFPAYGDGRVSLPNDQKALVNEEYINGHSESIVRDGVWSLIPGGAHIENLKKGDIIFSATQTEDLLKHGATHGHARAYAQGTASGVSLAPAYADGTSELDDTIKKVSTQAKDWIETALDRLERIVEKYQDIAESDYSNYKSSEKNYDKALKNLNKQLQTQKDSRAKYVAKANEVASAVGLSDELKKKVQNGTINIESLSEDDKKRVDAYQEWYEKILDCDKAIRELTKSQKDLAKAKVERVIEAYDTVIGKRENKADYYNAKQELRVSQGYNQKPGSKYEKYMKKELYYTNEQKRLTDKEIKEYKGRMKEYLKVNGHKTVDPEYQKMKKQLYSLQTEAVKLENEAAELVQALQDNREQIKQWAVDRWDRAGSKQDAVIDYAKANDNPEYQINEKIYQERIKSNARQINALQKLRAEKAEYYDIHFSSMNNEEAQKYLDSIAQIDEQILKIGSDIENLKNEIMELRWKPFDDAQDKLSNVITEYQTMQKLLGDAESFYNDDGSFTTNGLTNILLTQESIDATKQKIANYREGLNKLEEQYKNGCYSLDEYNEKSKQLLDGIQQESTALSELKQNMLDMYETQIKKENDLLQENIDKRKDALSAKEKYYDYDKTLKKKSKDINTLKSQIAALEGTSNAAAKARLEKLRAELADAEDDMADTMHQHEVDMKNTGYENFSNEANKALDNTLDAVKKNSSFQEAIISGMLTNVTTNYDNTYKHLHTVMDQYGVKVSSTFDTMIGKSADFNTSLIQQIKALETISNMKVTLPYGTSNGQGGSTTGNNTYTGAENGIHNTFNSNKDSTGAGNETPGTVNGKSYSFSLNKSEIFLTPNESYKLKVTWSPTAPLHSDIKWSSDKTDVAKVSSSGKVTATKGVQTSKGGGVTGILVGGLEKTFKATITAKSDFGSKTCVVHVMPDAHYDAIEEYANKNGLAMTNDKMQAALEYAYRNGGNHADKANIAVEGFKKAYLNDKPTYLKSWFNTLQNRPDGATDVPAGVSPLIGYFNAKGKKVGPKEMQQLADILEISTPGVKKYDSWGSALKNQILQKYKSYGFATGGIINKLIPADMDTLLGKAIISNGDQGFIGAKVGESVMTEEFTRLLKPSIAAMNNFTNMFNPVTPTATNNDYTINNEVNINVANMSNDLDIQDVANKVSTIINKNMTRDWRKLR